MRFYSILKKYHATLKRKTRFKIKNKSFSKLNDVGCFLSA